MNVFLGQPSNQTKKRSEETEPNYYFSQFRQDLLSVMRLENPVRNTKLPIPILINDRSWNGGHSAFKDIKQKMDFILCYFLVSLLDQTLHNVSSKHYVFDKIMCLPKPVGVSASYQIIFHPKNLLHYASGWAKENTLQKPLEVFDKLVSVFFRRLQCISTKY